MGTHQVSAGTAKPTGYFYMLKSSNFVRDVACVPNDFVSDVIRLPVSAEVHSSIPEPISEAGVLGMTSR